MEVLKVTPESFEDEVVTSSVPVVLDFWGPQCIPCIQLDPFIAELSQEYEGRVKVAKVIAPESRKLCGQLKVMGLPTFLAFKDGLEINRLVGDEVTQESITKLVEGLADGAITPASVES
jgi:thioredoxin 1